MADAVTEAANAAIGTGDSGLIALGAGLAILGGAIGTAMVQSSVGSSAIGVIAEKPEESSKLLLYDLIAEAVVVCGFVIPFLLLGKIA